VLREAGFDEAQIDALEQEGAIVTCGPEAQRLRSLS
jgi:hypothetical protein